MALPLLLKPRPATAASRGEGFAADFVACTLPLVAMLAVGCGDERTAETRTQAPVPVVLARATLKDAPIEIRTVGTAEPVATVQVVTQVGGLMQAVHFREGDFVKKGDLLFTIDTRPYQATLSAAQAELEKNRALADDAKSQVARYEKLVTEGVASQAELGRLRAQAASLDATLSANRAVIQSSSINVQFAGIRAPIDGRTGSLLVQAGNVVKTNETRPLVVIRTIEPIYVRFSAPEPFLPEVRDRMKEGRVTVEAAPRGGKVRAVSGELTFIESAVDPATGKIDMKARMANEGQVLWPGQFVDVIVRVGVDRGALVIPEAAVQAGQDGAYTFVVGADRRAHLRRVEVRRTVQGEAIIASGLSAGEEVVVDGQVRLRDGTQVQQKAPAAAPASSSAAKAGEPAR